MWGIGLAIAHVNLSKQLQIQDLRLDDGPG
jgi:hypothetical protein